MIIVVKSKCLVEPRRQAQPSTMDYPGERLEAGALKARAYAQAQGNCEAQRRVSHEIVCNRVDKQKLTQAQPILSPTTKVHSYLMNKKPKL